MLKEGLTGRGNEGEVEVRPAAGRRPMCYNN
jgi:hypothetical protein